MAEASARVIAFLFFVILARFGGPSLFGEVRTVLSAGQIAAGLGVPFLTSVSRLAGSVTSGRGVVALASSATRLASELTGWLLFTALGGVIAGVGYGWQRGATAAVFLATMGFGCNYFGTLITRSFSLPRALMFISFLGNAAQLAVLGLLIVFIPRAVTVNTVVVVYAVAFIVPVLTENSLRVLTRVKLTTIKTLGPDVLARKREYLSQLAQHTSHVLVVNLDLLALSVVASPKTVGQYAAIKSLVMIALLPATALFYLLIPAAVRRLNGEPDPGDRQILGLGFAGIVLSSGAMCLLANPLMRTLYGARFAGLGPAVAYGALGAGLYGLSLLRGAVWIARGRTGAFSIIVAGTAILGATTFLLFPALATALTAARVWAIANFALATSVGLTEWAVHRRRVQLVRAT